MSTGQQIPDSEPRRYPNSDGYIRLRWLVGPYHYVETYEHRVFDGHITTEEQVHHVNRNRADNRPENLHATSAAEHRAEHFARPWHAQAAWLYNRGFSTLQIGKKLGHDSSSVYRALVSLGVPLRSKGRVAIPKREERRAG